MQRPDTFAVAQTTAGFEGSSVSQGMPQVLQSAGRLVATQVSQPQRAAGMGTAKVTPIPGALELPCKADPELFFAESPQDVEYAKALCQDCPIRLTCFAGAMDRREPWGVWGGELFLRGEVVPRKRPRGRPRKTEVAA
jgi:WhiB family transcriptional regulator, redox-sensing transcriptional regulator